ncbi:MAG: flavin reductase family protein [Kiritimatiellae bacterium]|nr:flavin reductase family protein [Kiritimatiellia bacterium]MDD4736823.1 flavin reductase family protein [Kiritimatiellia bacterium]
MTKVKAGAINPLPVVPITLVGANVNGRPNYTAIGFVNGVNIKPPILYVSLNRVHHTAKGILENGTFSINIPSAKFVAETDCCGLVSGRLADKSALFTTFYGELETAPMIEEFPITCECRYTGQQVEFADDIVYFGEVIQVYLSDEVAGQDRSIDIAKVDPIVYSGLENKYRRLGEDVGAGWSIGRQHITKTSQTEHPQENG